MNPQNPTLYANVLSYMIAKIDAAGFYAMGQAGKQSATLIRKWLTKYKFKSWKTTGTKGTAVTTKMRECRAEKIAKTLNDTEIRGSHGRGISMETLKGGRIKLLVEDFGKDKKLNTLIKNHYDLAADHSGKNRVRHFLHSNAGGLPYPQAGVETMKTDQNKLEEILENNPQVDAGLVARVLKDNMKTAKAAPAHAGDTWTWTAFDSENKLIVFCMVGGRDSEYAIAFMDDSRDRLANRVQLTTDGHKACLEAVEGRLDYARIVRLYGGESGTKGHEKKILSCRMHRNQETPD